MATIIKTAKDLRAATYNPRSITAQQMHGLTKSIENFGDLSGIVFNRKTRTLISGHQRTASLKKWPSRAVLKPCSDEYGTVQIGFMEYKTDRGVITVPMRVVDWEVAKEKQANIAANAHGGDWDRKKLATLTAQLEKNPQFDIELIGFDANDLKLLHRYADGAPSQIKAREEAAAQEFQSVRGKATAEFQHVCPRCKFKFNDQ